MSEKKKPVGKSKKKTVKSKRRPVAKNKRKSAPTQKQKQTVVVNIDSKVGRKAQTSNKQTNKYIPVNTDASNTAILGALRNQQIELDNLRVSQMHKNKESLNTTDNTTVTPRLGLFDSAASESVARRTRITSKKPPSDDSNLDFLVKSMLQEKGGDTELVESFKASIRDAVKQEKKSK